MAGEKGARLQRWWGVRPGRGHVEWIATPRKVKGGFQRAGMHHQERGCGQRGGTHRVSLVVTQFPSGEREQPPPQQVVVEFGTKPS